VATRDDQRTFHPDQFPLDQIVERLNLGQRDGDVQWLKPTVSDSGEFERDVAGDHAVVLVPTSSGPYVVKFHRMGVDVRDVIARDGEGARFEGAAQRANVPMARYVTDVEGAVHPCMEIEVAGSPTLFQVNEYVAGKHLTDHPDPDLPLGVLRGLGEAEGALAKMSREYGPRQVRNLGHDDDHSWVGITYGNPHTERLRAAAPRMLAAMDQVSRINYDVYQTHDDTQSNTRTDGVRDVRFFDFELIRHKNPAIHAVRALQTQLSDAKSAQGVMRSTTFLLGYESKGGGDLAEFRHVLPVVQAADLQKEWALHAKGISRDDPAEFLERVERFVENPFHISSPQLAQVAEALTLRELGRNDPGLEGLSRELG
jgi:Ser/Thr protein kinase RdoA (MazF antagonist)